MNSLSGEKRSVLRSGITGPVPIPILSVMLNGGHMQQVEREVITLILMHPNSRIVRPTDITSRAVTQPDIAPVISTKVKIRKMRPQIGKEIIGVLDRAPWATRIDDMKKNPWYFIEIEAIP
jgi:hypothetical protein